MSSAFRNGIALFLILVSYACLVPGLYRPVMTIDVAPVLPFLGKTALYHQTRSILGTVGNLYDTGNTLVASLILLFSVIVPSLKGMLLVYVLAFRRAPFRIALFRFVDLIGKWSMADVFVVGIFLAYLAMGSVSGITAVLHEGFWLFLGYCLLSVAAVQCMRADSPAETPQPRRAPISAPAP